MVFDCLAPILLHASDYTGLLQTDGKYQYTHQLKKLSPNPQPSLPQELCNISSPINIPSWNRELQDQPDAQYWQIIL